MPNKLRLNIDFAKLQGAIWFTSPRTGEKCLVIVPSKSLMKRYPSKKEDQPDSLYGAIEIIPFKDGPNDRDETHFAKEPTTREERECATPLQMPYLGNAREYDNGPRQSTTSAPPRQQQQPPPQNAPALADSEDEIPF